MLTKTCKICGKEFQARWNHTKCCSPECSRENVRRLKWRSMGLERSSSSLVKKCVICGKEFQSRRGNAQCCSPECTRENKYRYAEHTYRERMRKQRVARRKERDEYLARRDLEYRSLHTPVKVSESYGIRTESRGTCPGGWQGRGKLTTHP